MQRHGWTLLFHDRVIEQLRGLQARAECAKQDDRQGCEGYANLGLFHTLSRLILEVVPSNPSRDAYVPDNMQGQIGGHWRRVEIGRSFQLFFRYDSKARVIVFAWIHEEQALWSAVSKSVHTATSRRRSDTAIHQTIGGALMAANQADLQPSKKR